MTTPNQLKRMVQPIEKRPEGLFNLCQKPQNNLPNMVGCAAPMAEHDCSDYTTNDATDDRRPMPVTHRRGAEAQSYAEIYC